MNPFRRVALAVTLATVPTLPVRAQSVTWTQVNVTHAAGISCQLTVSQVSGSPLRASVNVEIGRQQIRDTISAGVQVTLRKGSQVWVYTGSSYELVRGGGRITAIGPALPADLTDVTVAVQVTTCTRYAPAPPRPPSG